MSSVAGKMVNVEHRDEVAIVKMNRAPVNSLNMELMTELREAIAACESM
jgi:enoyl-CoA hydratase/carnithine racemase